MPAENRLEVVYQKPIKVLGEKPWFASEGQMALTNVDGMRVYGRGIPQNTIFSGILAQDIDGSFQLIIDKQPVLTPQGRAQTEDHKPVIGYEDPTLIQATDNPFSPLKEGVLCTQTYPATPKEGVYTNLVYFELNLLGIPTYNPRLVLSPLQAMEQNLAPNVDMVKEAELLPLSHNNERILLFEFADGRASHIGSGLIDGISLVKSLPYYTAGEDNSEHVSTAGTPVELEDGRLLLFFNRRRGKEWGITCMVLDRDNIFRRAVYPDWLIQAPQDMGRGPGGQLIAFGSCVYKLEDRLLRVLYHVNDNSVYESLVEIKGLL